MTDYGSKVQLEQLQIKQSLKISRFIHVGDTLDVYRL